MIIDPGIDIPLFIQIATSIEDAILTEIYPEETQIPSTTELSTALMINPATVLKGMNLLATEGIIYKKRGLGMFVSTGAAKIVRDKRKNSFKETYITSLISEAKKLGINKDDVLDMIEGGYKDE